MKNLFFLIVLFPFVAFSQSFKGIIKDAETLDPIPFVTISVDQSSYYVVSNEQGEFVLDAAQVMNKTIRIQNIYYSDFQKKIINQEFVDILLDPLSFEMEQLLIFNQPIKKVFEDVINHSEKTLQTQAKMATYYKEVYKERNQTLKEADAMVDFYIKSKATKIDAVVKESRVIDSEIQKAKTEKEKDQQILLAVSPEDMMESAMRFKVLRNIIKEKKYDCYITSKKSKEKEVNTLYFSPKEGVSEEMLFAGKVIYDPERLLILEFEIQFDENARKLNSFKNFIIARAKFNEFDRLVKYNFANEMYYLTYLQANYDVSVTSKLAKINTSLSSFSQIYVLTIDKTSTFPQKNQIFTLNQLYQAGTKYNSEFWTKPEVVNYAKD